MNSRFFMTVIFDHKTRNVVRVFPTSGYGSLGNLVAGLLQIRFAPVRVRPDVHT
jgi:hypothetical protein